jgi:hypothetical protein
METPFTHTYIAMATAAEEIQAMRPNAHDIDIGKWNPPHPGIGSFFYKIGSRGPEFRVLSWDNDTESWMVGAYSEDESEFTWLPRLDQLLGLWDENTVPEGLRGWSLVKQCHEPPYIGERDADLEEWKTYLSQFKDWHEVILALKMREKYGKTWRDGKAWI